MIRRIILLSAIFFLLPTMLFSREENADTLNSTMLPELNILSIKQSGNLENQAVSASTVTLGEVTLNDIADIRSLSDLVPNFYIPSYGSRITSSIYVRGIGARMDQPSVGLTIDNLPVLNKDAYDLDIPEIYEIEMLRGPQSSLYGRNTLCGLINIRTISPMQYQGLRLMGEVATNKSIRLSGGWFHKFNRNTALSAVIGLNALHGDFKNEYNGTDVGKEKSGNVRVKFEWFPLANLSIANTLSSSLLYQTGYAYESVELHQINYNDTCFYHRFLLNDALTLNYNHKNLKLSANLSAQYINDNMTLDQDFLPLSYFNLTQKKQATDLTAEFIAQRAGVHNYHWVGGAFAFYRDFKMQAPVTFKQDGIYNLIEQHRNEANLYYPIKWDTDNFLLDSDFKLPSFGVAVYHESRYKAGNWDFTAALRLDYEKITLHYGSYTNTSYTIYSNPSGNLDTPYSQMTPYRNVDILIDDDGTLSMDFLTLLPKVSVLYNLPSALGNVYATFGKGYKAGGYNTQMFSDVLQQKLMGMMGIGAKYNIDEIVKYKPEYCFNYEVGAHLDFYGLSTSDLSNLTAEVSLYYLDCHDQQLTVFPDGTTTGRIMTNAGRTRSLGGELALRWQPWSPLTFTASYGYTNARFIKFNDGREDYAGNRLPYAPQNTLFFQGLYTLAPNTWGGKSLLFDVNVRGTGDIYWNEGNTLRQPLYALLGASVSLKAPRWEVQLWGRNLTNTDYYTFYFMSIGNEFLQRGAKISGGITLRIFV